MTTAEAVREHADVEHAAFLKHEHPDPGGPLGIVSYLAEQTVLYERRREELTSLLDHSILDHSPTDGIPNATHAHELVTEIDRLVLDIKLTASDLINNLAAALNHEPVKQSLSTVINDLITGIGEGAIGKNHDFSLHIEHDGRAKPVRVQFVLNDNPQLQFAFTATDDAANADARGVPVEASASAEPNSEAG